MKRRLLKNERAFALLFISNKKTSNIISRFFVFIGQKKMEKIFRNSTGRRRENPENSLRRAPN